MPTVKYNDFNLSNLTFSTPEENKVKPEITKYQLMSLPTYTVGDDSSLPTIQGPWTLLDFYGFPSKTDRDGKPRLNNAGQPLSDIERGKLKVPFNFDVPESKALYDLLVSIDKKCAAEREQIFGDKKKANAYVYQPIVRRAVLDPDADENAPEKPDYFVIKLDFENGTKLLRTELWMNEDRKRSQIQVTSLDDLQKYLRYKCEFRPIFTFCKLFSSKGANGDGKRTYGIGLKLKMVEVKPMKATTEKRDVFFLDSDSEDDTRKELVASTSVDVQVQSNVVSTPVVQPSAAPATAPANDAPAPKRGKGKNSVV
jgi:hypothetical protein